MTTTFSGVWNANSLTFTRVVAEKERTFYYEAIGVDISTPGSYSFTGSSMVKVNGDLYRHDFDLVDPNRDLIRPDVKTDAEDQFRITASLQPGDKYVLVVTTSYPNVGGSYSIEASGPSTIKLSKLVPSNSKIIAVESESHRPSRDLTRAPQ